MLRMCGAIPTFHRYFFFVTLLNWEQHQGSKEYHICFEFYVASVCTGITNRLLTPWWNDLFYSVCRVISDLITFACRQYNERQLLTKLNALKLGKAFIHLSPIPARIFILSHPLPPTPHIHTHSC